MGLQHMGVRLSVSYAVADYTQKKKVSPCNFSLIVQGHKLLMGEDLRIFV